MPINAILLLDLTELTIPLLEAGLAISNPFIIHQSRHVVPDRSSELRLKLVSLDDVRVWLETGNRLIECPG